MSETTEILFNSPALHSLRRDQLQKLCKFHSIKANGKNTELIERLKYHALTLPKDDPLSIAARSEQSHIVANPHKYSLDVSQDERDYQSSRFSDQWEVVMEGIQEVEENASSHGSLSSRRTIGTSHSSDGIGTNNSKRSSPMKALANFGVIRSSKSENSVISSKANVEEPETQLMDELTQHSIPYSATRPATPPLNDNFTFDPTNALHIHMSFKANGEPLPGGTLRPGEPAPADGRLSLGLGLGAPAAAIEQQPTTTIRLVSKSSSDTVTQPRSFEDPFQTPKLKPFATSFDILMSPSGQNEPSGDAAFWAPDSRPGQFKKLYPTLTIDDLPPDLPPSPVKAGNDKTGVGSKDHLGVAPSRTSTTPEPFIFGSPLPQHSVSNTQFTAAATSVLEEMNKRLIDSGVQGVGMDLIHKLQPGAHNQADLREMKPLPSRLSIGGMKGGGEIKKKFDDIHKAEFDKMEGIDGAVRRRAVRLSGDNKLSSNGTLRAVAGKKRKSNVLGELGDGNGMPRRPATKPASFGTDIRSINGGRSSGSTRVISHGHRPNALPGAFGGEEEEEEAPESSELVEEGEERGGKRPRVDPDAACDDDAAKVSTTSITEENRKAKAEDEDENAMDVDNEDHESEEESRRQSRQLDREREAIKRKLEISRAKRRSSVGGVVAAATRSATVAAAKNSRVSGTRPPATPKVKTSRFGFLASAKKLVTSVWNRGKAAAMPANSNAPSKSTAAPARTAGLEAPTKSSMLKRKTPGPAPKPVTAGTSLPIGTANSRPSAAQTQELKNNSGVARSKSPIPPTLKQPTTGNGTIPSARAGSIAGSKVSCVGTSSSSVGGTSGIGTKSSTTSNTVVGSMGTRSQPPVRSGSNSSSRLLAPTASSLAKMKKTDTTPGSATPTPTPSSTLALPPASGHKRVPSPLGSITNSPGVRGIPRQGGVSGLPSRKASGSSSVTPTKIFSKPVTVNGISGIPVLKKSEGETGTREDGDKDVLMSDADADAGNIVGKPTVVRQRTFTRKPRISRSKVIAKLASQRAAAFSPPSRREANCPATPLSRASAAVTLHAGATPKTPRGLRGKRTRSSIGTRLGRTSFAGAGVLSPGAGKERNVLASAKKRVRQTEHARRRSQLIGLGGDE